MGAKSIPFAGISPADLSSLYLAVAEHAPLPMASVEGAGHLVRYVNPAFCRLIAKSKEQLVGTPISEVLPKGDKCVKMLDRVFCTGKSESYLEQGHSKPHPIFWSYTMWPVMANERPVGVMIQVTETAQFHQRTIAINEALILGAVRQHEFVEAAENLNAQLHLEITERKQAEESLRESEELFSKAFRLSPDYMTIVRLADRIIIKANEAVCAAWGSTPDEVVGKPTKDYSNWLNEDERLVFMRRLEEEGDYQNYETTIRMHDERVVWLNVSCRIITLNGEACILSLMRDVTERKQAEDALRESEKRFRALVIAGSDVVYRMSPDWTEMRELDGRKFIVDTEKPSGAWLHEYIPPEDQSHVMAIIKEAIRTRTSFELEHRVRRVDGTFGWTFSRAIPLFDAKGEIVEWFGAASDVTQRKQAAEQIRQLNAELEQRVVERTAQLQAANEELEAFSYSVSHDLRAPLRHVMGFVNLLQKDAGPALSKISLGHLATISLAAKRMGNLIDDLLAFSRVGRAELQKTAVNLDELVQETLGDVQAETKERNIAWEIQPLPAVQADRALLRMVLVNLISNAVKFTGARNPAKIEIGCASGKQKAESRKAELGVPPLLCAFPISALPQDETVIFIRDNGAGFDPRYAGKLFGVFQRLHSHDEFEGTGIGLANVQRIIQRHGGRAWAEGVVDGGATFYFSIPKPGERAILNPLGG